MSWNMDIYRRHHKCIATVAVFLHQMWASIPVLLFHVAAGITSTGDPLRMNKPLMSLWVACTVIFTPGRAQVTSTNGNFLTSESYATIEDTVNENSSNISSIDPLPHMMTSETPMVVTRGVPVRAPSSLEIFTKNFLKAFLHIRFILAVFGIVGNVLSILVILQPNFRQLPVMPYMLGVAVTDSLYLFSRSVVDWFKVQFNYMIPGLTSLCQVRYFFIVASLNVSSMLLGALSMERMYAVRYPLLAKVKLTRKLSYGIIAAIFVAVIAVYIPMLLAINQKDCKPVPGWEFYQRNIYVWSQIICTNFIPDVLIVFSNVVMLVTIRGRLSAKSNEASGESATHGGTDNQAAMTRLAVTLAITHFILTMPIMTLKAYQLSVGIYNFFTSGPVVSMLEALFLALMVLNHSINFILYIGTSTAFRIAMKKMFCKVCTGE